MGTLSVVHYNTQNLGWSYQANLTAFQFDFNAWWWEITEWVTVLTACALYIPSYFKMRSLKIKWPVQQGRECIEFRLLILCAINTV